MSLRSYGRAIFFKPEQPPPVLAFYQRFWHDSSGGRTVDQYLTAALLRQDHQWMVLAVDGDFRGAWEVTFHHRLEDARDAIVAWVGKAREVSPSKVPGSVLDKIDRLRMGEPPSD